MPKLTLRALALTTCFIFAILPARAQDDDSFGKETAESIAKGYSLTKTGFASADRVTDPGEVYTFRVEGLLGRAVLDHVTPTNTIVNGKLVSPAKGFIASFGAKGNDQQVNLGDRYYLHEIHVTDEAVIYTFLSVNQIDAVYQGRSSRTRLRLYLSFPFPKKDSHVRPTAESMHALSDPIFVKADSPDATPTVQLGQTAEEVRKILGPPDKEIDLGSKKILAYKGIKVTLIDDKVTDAE